MYATDSQIVQNKKKEFPSEEEEPMQVKTSVATGFGVVTVLLIPLALVGIGVVIRYRRKKMD